MTVADHLEALNDVAGVMAGDKVGLGHVVRRTDRGITKAQVRDGDAAGLLGVVLEVGLDVLVGVVADDLDSRFVSTDSTVRTEAPEFTGRKTRGIKRHFRFARKAEVGNVVDDAKGEAVERMIFLQFFEDSEEVFRKNVFGAHTGAAADDVDVKTFFFYEVRQYRDKAVRRGSPVLSCGP